jgi:hypothetical protein
VINTPHDLIRLTDSALDIEDLGAAITADIDRWMDDKADTRSDGEVAVDFLLSPDNVYLVAPVLIAAGWRPPTAARSDLTTSHQP